MQAEVDPSKVRGRAYNCGRCSDFCGEWRRVVAHIYKYHIPLAEAPYYCTLCTFRCLTLVQLENHVTNYREHVLKEAAAEEGDENYDVRNHLKKSVNSYILQETDLKRLNKEESQSIWKKRSKKTSDENRPSVSVPTVCQSQTSTMNEDQPSVSIPTVPQNQPTAVNQDVLDLGLNESFNFEHLFSDSPLPPLILSPQPIESSSINTPLPQPPVNQPPTVPSVHQPSSPRNPPSVTSASSSANCEVSTALKSIENTLVKLDGTMDRISRGINKWTDAVKNLTEVMKGINEEKEKEDTRRVLSTSHHWDNRKREWRRQPKY